MYFTQKESLEILQRLYEYKGITATWRRQFGTGNWVVEIVDIPNFIIEEVARRNFEPQRAIFVPEIWAPLAKRMIEERVENMKRFIEVTGKILERDSSLPTKNADNFDEWNW